MTKIPKLSELENVTIENIRMNDYPDFVDAIISYAEFEGEPLTEAQLDFIQENHPEFVQELALEKASGA